MAEKTVLLTKSIFFFLYVKATNVHNTCKRLCLMKYPKILPSRLFMLPFALLFAAEDKTADMFDSQAFLFEDQGKLSQAVSKVVTFSLRASRV